MERRRARTHPHTSTHIHTHPHTSTHIHTHSHTIANALPLIPCTRRAIASLLLTAAVVPLCLCRVSVQIHGHHVGRRVHPSGKGAVSQPQWLPRLSSWVTERKARTHTHAFLCCLCRRQCCHTWPHCWHPSCRASSTSRGLRRRSCGRLQSAPTIAS